MLALLIACTVVIGAGWGIRGAFGHSRGAMMPGAMLGATLVVCAMRPDWWRRAAIIMFACSIGWGVGGQSSYGIIIGYSMGGTLRNSLFGYASLWLVGGLYSGIGAGFLALALTKSRSWLQQFIWPLTIMYLAWLSLSYLSMLEPLFESLLGQGEATVNAWWHHLDFFVQSIEYYEGGEEARGLTYWLHDTIWACVLLTIVVNGLLWIVVPRWRNANALILLLAVGWFAGMYILIELLSLRMNPHRAETWAGVLGMQVALVGYFISQRHWVGFMLASYGFIAGAIGFSVGDFIQMTGNAKWGPIGEYAWLQEFGYWTVMEQLFGCFMGFGTAVGLIRLVNKGLAPPEEDTASKSIDLFGLFFVFGPLLVFNFRKPFRTWMEHDSISDVLFTFPINNVAFFFSFVYLLVLLCMLSKMRKRELALVPASHLGQAQLLAFLVNIAVLMMYLLIAQVSASSLFTFVSAIIIGLLIIFSKTEKPVDISNANIPAESFTWFPGLLHWILWPLSAFLLVGLAWTTMQFEMKQKQYRFESDVPTPEEEQVVEPPPTTSLFPSIQLPEFVRRDYSLMNDHRS
ncbi:hypothetical protein Pla110_02880 [Polystyrenella longa]|uniref:Uncharacterized protein n=2 Tax=Polystyrenella longa TaxID=2528007 RepID=A0A518CHD7_9PLAN|nr:hypothetical protein Pla110_02880 [Polystyrenella longa]